MKKYIFLVYLLTVLNSTFAIASSASIHLIKSEKEQTGFSRNPDCEVIISNHTQGTFLIDGTIPGSSIWLTPFFIDKERSTYTIDLSIGSHCYEYIRLQIQGIGLYYANYYDEMIKVNTEVVLK